MKRLFVVCAVVMALVASGTMAMARDVGGEGQVKPNIKCCFQDGQCLETKKDNCALKKGIVVQDCKECPGVWGKGENK
ncbi:MAG: hypothetical protein HY912_01995 [Desulfomonile tiedjei]|uniref:Uncharacterized protein n=1 Tax=Desulfomonile tiedjei TaxID=2358 RepID=A0A9D6V305_9BACT|nr:hypothetical protein [Desulfomonile tiedjei]